jgi:hypothetical protein
MPHDLSFPTPTVEQLLAIEACRDAARRYSYGVDRLDAAVMKSAYWPDAIDEHGAFVGNAWEFCDRVVASHDRWTWTMHTIFNHRVDLDADGDHANGEVYNISYLCSGGDEGSERRLGTWYGRYLDTYERRGNEWRIVHRVCVHHGDIGQQATETMGIDTSQYRPGAFDRPAGQRRIGP